MMDLITVDFETYYSSNYHLRQQGMTTQKYIDSPEFEVIGVVIKRNNEKPVRITGSMSHVQTELRKFNWEESYALAHNCIFDASILAWRFGIYPKTLLDTLSMARAIHGVDAGGSLSALAERYGLGTKGTEVVQAKGLRLCDFSDGQLASYMDYCENDVELTVKLFEKLAPSFSSKEIALIDMTLKMHTVPQFELDREVLEENLKTVRERKAELLSKIDGDLADLRSNVKFADMLRALDVEPPMKDKKPTKTNPNPEGQTYAFAKTDQGMLDLLEHEDERVQVLVAARLGVKSSIEETRTESFIRIHDEHGGLLPIPLRYFGTITGRWAGSELINLQNLPRTSKLKSSIKAPIGHSIVGADLSNIELRVGLYFAGQMDKVKLLGDGMDLYKDFASNVFNVSYDGVSDDQRFVGKTSQLSLIYGTGHETLCTQIKTLSGKDIGLPLAEAAVELYRSEYTQVKAAWKDAGMALEAILNNEYTEIGLGQLKLQVYGRKGIMLPSGLFLQYPGLSKTKNEKGFTQWHYQTRKGKAYIYPAKCFQNCVQALARCVIGESMVRANRRIFMGLTIHDAIYGIAKTQQVDDMLRFIITELRKAPAWLPGIPLDAEGGYGDSLAFKMKKVII